MIVRLTISARPRRSGWSDFPTIQYGRISSLSTGTCVIGIKPVGTIPMIVGSYSSSPAYFGSGAVRPIEAELTLRPLLPVDAILNLYLTCAFVIPIWKTRFTTARSLAIKSSIASAAALATSGKPVSSNNGSDAQLTPNSPGANVVIITALHGKQLCASKFLIFVNRNHLSPNLNVCVLFSLGLPAQVRKPVDSF